MTTILGKCFRSDSLVTNPTIQSLTTQHECPHTFLLITTSTQRKKTPSATFHWLYGLARKLIGQKHERLVVHMRSAIYHDTSRNTNRSWKVWFGVMRLCYEMCQCPVMLCEIYECSTVLSYVIVTYGLSALRPWL